MKITHIITRLILGGAQENTLLTCKGLASRGHDVTLITGPAIGPEGELFEQTKSQKFKTIVINSLRRQINPVFDIPAYNQLKKLLTELQPDIVHTHSAKAGILGRFAANNLKNRPKIVHTLHGLSFHPYQSPLLNKFYIAVEKAVAKHTDFFISVADAMTNQTVSAGIAPKENFITAYSAVEEQDFLKSASDEQRAEFRRKYNIPPDAVVLVTIARLFMLKGHEFIMQSAPELAKRYKNVYWLFVGNGNLSNNLKNQAASLGLADRIKFTGLLPPSQIPLAIQSSDILVHCSLREGLARALPQAMLCAKPVISFDCDGANEVVNQNTGRIIEPKNISQLIAASAELIENPQLRQTLGLNAQNFVKDKFAPEKMIDIIEMIYFKLMEEKLREKLS